MSLGLALEKKNKPIVISPPGKLELPDFGELWRSRDLLFFLVKRDLKVRFQQTVIGVLWIVLQPLIQTLIFYVIMGLLMRVPTGNVPYEIFYISGFVVWQLFSQIVNSCAFSLLGNVGVITKIYFPRLALPVASTLGSLIDFGVGFLLLLAFLLPNHYPITIRYLWIIPLLIITVLFSSGVGLLFGALMVVFRDTKNLLGFILQIWMFSSPVLYSMQNAPEEMRVWFYLNPMTSLIDSFRWAFLGSGQIPPPGYLALSFLVAVALWFAGAIAFRQMENRIADVM